MNIAKNRARLGHFGWEYLFNGVVLPVIFRDQEKLCAVQIFIKHTFLHFNYNLLDNELMHFRYVNEYKMTDDEYCLINEINHYHCGSMYKHTFKAGDTLMKYEDAKDILEFIHNCSRKLLHGDQTEVRKCGIVSITWPKATEAKLIPFISIDKKRFIPFDYVKGVPYYNGELTYLQGINIHYMKFLYKILKLDTSTLLDSIQCVPIREIRRKYPSNIEITNYWPKRDTYRNLFTFNSPQPRIESEVNNAIQFVEEKVAEERRNTFKEKSVGNHLKKVNEKRRNEKIKITFTNIKRKKIFLFLEESSTKTKFTQIDK